MAHGNKKYFFEDLKVKGDTLLAKPSPKQIRVNVYSLKNQIKLYQKEADKFEFTIDEHKNGNATITRIT